MSTTPRARRTRRRNSSARLSPERRRGLLRLVILLGSVAGLIALGVSALGNGKGGPSASLQGGRTGGAPPPTRLTASISSASLPTPLHGEALAPAARGLLVIGGADPADASQDSVYRLDPASSSVSRTGSLLEPLHDAAAATLGSRTLVFGGGNTSTLNTVQALSPGGRATSLGRMPAALSDLAAVHVAGAAYLIGGFDGQAPSASVLETTDGRSFVRAARLPTPVRYAAAATVGDKIYVFGGELADGSDTDQIQEYDIGTERAVVAGHLPEPVSHAAAVNLGGSLFVLGGRRSGSASDRVLRFDPAHRTIVRAGRLPRPVFDGAAAVYRGRAYLVGGLGAAGTALSSITVLRPAA